MTSFVENPTHPRVLRLGFFEDGAVGAKVGVLPLGVEDDFESSEKSGYSHRNTFAESAVHTMNVTASAVRSRACAHHASPFQIPSSSDTA